MSNPSNDTPTNKGRADDATSWLLKQGDQRIEELHKKLRVAITELALATYREHHLLCASIASAMHDEETHLYGLRLHHDDACDPRHKVRLIKLSEEIAGSVHADLQMEIDAIWEEEVTHDEQN